jgi:hypothetical protein
MKILNSRTISETSFKRQSFTHDEIKFLEKHYNNHKYADKTRRTELAKILLIEEKKIGNWFRNKRRQERNHQKSNIKLLLSANMLLSNCLPGETSDRKSFVKTLALNILLGKEDNNEKKQVTYADDDADADADGDAEDMETKHQSVNQRGDIKGHLTYEDEYPIALLPCSNCCQTTVVYPCPCEIMVYCGLVCQAVHWETYHKHDPQH